MNKRGHPETLVAAQPGNLNAVRHGAHSPRLIQERATEIAAELTQSFAFSPTQRLAVHEVACCMAILEAIDRDLDERGLEDKRGRPRYLLNHRWRVSRQLDHWLAKISDAIARQSAAGEEPPRAELADYVRELERIALGRDPSASARDRLAALKELVKLDAAAASAASHQIVNVNPLAGTGQAITEPEDEPKR
jgi:hypothetical protein